MFNISNIMSESNNLIWMKFDIKPMYWNLGFNLFVGLFICPRKVRLCIQKKISYVIEHEMANMKNKYPHYKFLIGGNFNAYTHQEPDYIEFDSMTYINDDIEYVEDTITETRYNLDKRETNAYGNALLDLCKSSGLRILNGRSGKDKNIGNFTCITDNSASVINYFVADFDFVNNVSDFEIYDRLESIHMPLRVQLRFSNTDNIPNTSEILPENIPIERNCFRYYFKNDQEQEYIRTLSEQLENMFANCIELVENNLFTAALEKLMACIMTAAEGMKQSTVKHVSKTVNQYQPWFDDECVSFRSKTLKALQYFRTARSLESLHTYQSLKKTYRNLIKDTKETFKQDRTAKLEKAYDDKIPKEIWRVLKTGIKPPSINITQNAWFEYFSNLFNEPNNLNNDHNFHGEMGATNETLDSPITASDIRASIMDLKSKKSPSIDGIPSEFFKVAYDKLIPFFETLFNKFYDCSFFPEDWGISIISPVPKVGETNKPRNYRGISLQQVTSKIYINTLNKRFTKWSDENEIIGEEQAGFRKSYSAIDNLLCLQTLVTKYLKIKGGRFYDIFFDFEKVFDRMDRNALNNNK